MQNTSLKKSRRFQQTNYFLTFAISNSYFKILFTLILFLFASLSANAAVTVDSKSSNRDSSLVGLSKLTWTHTVGSGSDRALYVGVSSSTTLLPVSVAPSLLSVAGVTYNGIPMTRVGSAQSVPVELLGELLSKSYVEVYRLVNPPSGAHNVEVSFSTLGLPINIFINQAVGGAVSYNGVDQVTPNGFFASNSGTSSSPSLTVNGGTNEDLIMDVLASSPNARDFAVAAGQNLQWEGDFTPLLAPTFDLGAGSTKAGASSVVTNWTMGSSNGWVLGGLAIRAASNPPSVFTVNTNLDNESNGCAVGNCTLREAITDANNTAQPDTIVFAPDVTGTIDLIGGQLVASSDITINGPGARNLAVRGDNNDRVFLIATPLLGGDITVNISGLTISNGFAKPVLIGSTLIGDGGGILNGALLGILSGTSTLNLTEVNVSNNSATTLGGGIATRLNARTNITRSLISNNTGATAQVLVGDVGGGGISNVGGITTISNTTVTNNRSLAAGGGILNAAGIVNLTNSTISHNRSTVAGGGVVSIAGVLQILGVTNLRNTIIANNNDLLALNVLGRDVVGVLGSFKSLGNNLIGSNFGADVDVDLRASVIVNGSAQVNANLDLVGGVAAGNQIIDPKLGVLQNNGGATNTRLPSSDSPAIDRGNNCVLTNVCTPNPQNNNPSFALTLEQRGAGFPRLLGTTIDIGATEGSEVVTPIVVNSLLDNENNGCAVGACTLREAINAANATSRADTINIPVNLSGTIFLTAGQLIAYTDMTINGPGARNLKVNGSGTNRVFLIATPTSGDDITVNINNITIENGSAQPVLIGSTLIGDGGGILNGALLGVLSGTSTLNLSRVSVSNNKTTTLGGGIANRLNAVTNVYRSLVSNNSSDGVLPNLGGGGISNTAGTMMIINTTISDNKTLAAGGGILNIAGTVSLVNDTISNNRSTLAGGGVVSTVGVIPTVLGVTDLRNTIIANNNDLLALNVLGRDVVGVLGSFKSLGNNLIGSNFGADVDVDLRASVIVNGSAQVNANLDLVGGVAAGNQIIDPKLGALQNNGGLTDTRIPLTGSPAIDRGNNCVLTNTCSTPQPFALSTEQRGAGYPRLQNSRVDIGAVEALAPTAAGTTIAGRATQTNGKGIFRALVLLTDRNGTVRTASTSFNGSFRFDSVDAQQTYILHVQVQDYDFATQVITPTADLLDLRLVGIPSGGGLSSF